MKKNDDSEFFVCVNPVYPPFLYVFYVGFFRNVDEIWNDVDIKSKKYIVLLAEYEGSFMGREVIYIILWITEYKYITLVTFCISQKSALR